MIRSETGAAGYRRDLGLIEATAIVIGRIIGSGIFRTPGPIMALVGSTSLFGAAWVIGGVVTVFGAVIYAELVAMMPKSGGPYVYLKEAYHPVVAFLRGWAMFFVSETAAIAAVALVFAEYFNSLLSSAGYASLGRPLVLFVALGAVWIMTLANCFGVFLSGKIQNLFSFLKVGILGGIIVIAFGSHGSMHHFVTPLVPETWSFEHLLALGAALRYTFFAFSGWEGSTYIAEEVKNPGHNLPLALLFGITGVLFLYAGVNSAYIYLLPPAVIAASPWVAADAMNIALGSAGGILVSAAVMMNTFGNVSTQILVKSRTWHAMARDGLFFKALGVTSRRFGTPNNSLIAQGIWASVLLAAAGFAGDMYEQIIAFFAATGTVFNILTFYSIVILRKKYPGLHRPYRAWLYPFSLWIILGLYGVFFIITMITAFFPSLIGLGLTATGLLYYILVVKKRVPV